MKRMSIVLSIVSMLFIGCQSSTPYKSAMREGHKFGFKNKKVSDGLYRVTFKGNEHTTRAQAETYMTYRAAELAKNQGYKYFEFVKRTDKKVLDFDANYAASSFDYPYVNGWSTIGQYRYPYYTSGFSWSYNPQLISVDTNERYTAIGYVRMHKKSENSSQDLLRADQVIVALQDNMKFHGNKRNVH